MLTFSAEPAGINLLFLLKTYEQNKYAFIYIKKPK